MKRFTIVAMMVLAAVAVSAQQYEWGTERAVVMEEAGEYRELGDGMVVVDAEMLDAEVMRVYVFDDDGLLRGEINYFPLDAGDRLIPALRARFGRADASTRSGAIWGGDVTRVVVTLSSDTIALSYSAIVYDDRQQEAQRAEDASEL